MRALGSADGFNSVGRCCTFRSTRDYVLQASGGEVHWRSQWHSGADSRGKGRERPWGNQFDAVGVQANHPGVFRPETALPKLEKHFRRAYNDGLVLTAGAPVRWLEQLFALHFRFSFETLLMHQLRRVLLVVVFGVLCGRCPRVSGEIVPIDRPIHVASGATISWEDPHEPYIWLQDGGVVRDISNSEGFDALGAFSANTIAVAAKEGIGIANARATLSGRISRSRGEGEYSGSYMFQDQRQSPRFGAFSVGSFPWYQTIDYNFQIDSPTTLTYAMETTYEGNLGQSVSLVAGQTYGGTAYIDHPPIGHANSFNLEPEPIQQSIVANIPLMPGKGYVRFLDTSSFGTSNSVPDFEATGRSTYRSRFAFQFGGATQEDPVFPDDITPDGFLFHTAISGLWYDPIAAHGFEFTMLDGSLFTRIEALPAFLINPVTVTAGEVALGQFGAGESVDFTSLGGVSSFKVTGINPTVDGEDPLAFPIQLSFDSAIAGFAMKPLTVPEPSMAVLVVVGCAAFRYRRR